jgi:O-antigen/teichoic acid export membrane protein
LLKFLRSDFARHGAIVFASSMIVNALNYVFHVLMTRRLGVDAYGELYALLAGLVLFSVPTSVLTMVVVRYAAEFRAVDDRARLGALAAWLIRRTTIAGVVLVGFGFLAQGPVAAYLRLGDSRAVVATSAVLALSVIGPTVRGVLQGIEAFRPFAISALIEGCGRVVLGVGLVYAGLGVNGALLGQACALALGLAYTWFAIRRRIPRVDGPLRVDVRRLVRTTAGVAAAMLALAVLTSADLLLVKHLFSPYEAGLYSAVSLVGKVLLFVVGFLPTIVLPKATARVARGESPLAILRQATIAIAAFCAAGLAGLYFEPWLALRVMSGTAFLSAAPYVFPYGLAMALLGAVTVVVNYKIGLHRFDFLVPLAAIAVLEVAAISLFHTSLWDVVRIVLAGNTLALGTSLYRVTAVQAMRPQPGTQPPYAPASPPVGGG